MVDQVACDQYWNQGWLVVEGVFEAGEVDGIAELATEIGLRELSSALDVAIDRSDDGQQAPRKVVQPFVKDPIFRQFALDSRVIEILKMLLGKQPLLMTDQVFMKPSRFGSAKPFHQDNACFRGDLYPELKRSDDCGTVDDGTVPRLPLP